MPSPIVTDPALALFPSLVTAGDNALAVRTFIAVLHKEDDLIVAECPEVGTVNQGHTIEEAIANLKEVTEFFLEEFPFYDSGAKSCR